MNKYLAFYRGKKIEVAASTSLAAQQTAAAQLKAKKSWEVTIQLVELANGEEVESHAD